MDQELNLGEQPLHALMLELGLSNHDLVSSSPEPLTHKAVQRARKGRRLTPHMRRRLTAALNRAVQARINPPERREWKLADLFNY
jgi:hypothetical protein